jgi:hypothetical protein
MPGARVKEQPHHRKAFELWYNMDKRNLTEVGRQVGKSANTLAAWAKNFKWEARAAVRDAKAAAKTEELVVDEIAEMNKRHLTYADAMQRLGMKSLARTNDFKPQDAVKAVETGVKIERLVRDQPTEQQAVQIKIEIQEINKKGA